MRFSILVILGGLVVSSLGCGSNPGPRLEAEEVVPVSGTLTYKGKPLADHQVTFIPTDGKRAATGVTDSSGNFKLGTNVEGDGATPGTHKVSVVWIGPPADDSATEGPIDNPALMPKPKIAIPAKYHSQETSGLTQQVPEGGVSDLKIDLQ